MQFVEYFCASFVRRIWENHFICIYFSYRILQKHSWSLVLSKVEIKDRKLGPSVTEQSDGPMDTVAFTMTQAIRIGLDCV